MKTLKIILVIMGLFFLLTIFVIIHFIEPAKPQKPLLVSHAGPRSTPPPPSTQPLPEKQEKPKRTPEEIAEHKQQCEKLIESLQKEGVFGAISWDTGVLEVGPQIHLVVRPQFYLIDMDLKEKFVRVVMAWGVDANPAYDLQKSLDRLQAPLYLYDSRSGKQVGKWLGKVVMD